MSTDFRHEPIECRVVISPFIWGGNVFCRLFYVRILPVFNSLYKIRIWCLTIHSGLFFTGIVRNRSHYRGNQRNAEIVRFVWTLQCLIYLWKSVLSTNEATAWFPFSVNENQNMYLLSRLHWCMVFIDLSVRIYSNDVNPIFVFLIWIFYPFINYLETVNIDVWNGK